MSLSQGAVKTLLMVYLVSRETLGIFPLDGSICKAAIITKAVSGGGRGATGHPYGPGGILHYTDLDPQSKEYEMHGKPFLRGGPIPTGKYSVLRPAFHLFGHHMISGKKVPKYVWSSQLRPQAGQFMFHRGGFFIHGMGPLGSDGCIVPIEPRHLWTREGVPGTGLSGTIAPYLQQQPGTLWVGNQFLPVDVPDHVCEELPDHVRRIVGRIA